MMLNLGRLAAVFLLVQMFSTTQARKHLCRFGKYSAQCQTGFQCKVHNVFGVSVGVCGCDAGHVHRGSRCVPLRLFPHAKDCTLPTVAHASAHPSGNTIRHSTFVFYKCHHGYKQNGSMVTLCHDGQLTARPPTCQSLPCPVSVANGVALESLSTGKVLRTINPGKTVNYICEMGYELIGSSSARCITHHKLTQLKPKCEPIQCPITNILNGFAVAGVLQPFKNSIPYMAKVTYSCQTGFSLNGTASATCTYDKTLSSPPPKCQDNNECSSPLLNSCASSANTVCQNTNGSYQCICADGYEMNGTECLDQNECANPLLHDCDVNATCANNNGSYECVCKKGFVANGTHCEEDVNKEFSFLVAKPTCLPVCHNGECGNNDTHARCECHQGWTGPTCHVCMPGHSRCPIPTEPWRPSNLFIFGSDILIAIVCIMATTCVKKDGPCFKCGSGPATKTKPTLAWLNWVKDATRSHSQADYHYTFQDKPTEASRSGLDDLSESKFSLCGVSMDILPADSCMESRTRELLADNDYPFYDMLDDGPSYTTISGNGTNGYSTLKDGARVAHENEEERPEQPPFGGQLVLPDTDIQFSLRYSLVNDLPQQFETATSYVHAENMEDQHQYSLVSATSRKQSQHTTDSASTKWSMQIVRNLGTTGYVESVNMRPENDYPWPNRHQSQREKVLNRSFGRTGSNSLDREEVHKVSRMSAACQAENDSEINALISSLQKPSNAVLGTGNLTWYRRSISGQEELPTSSLVAPNNNGSYSNGFLSMDETTQRRFSNIMEQQGSRPRRDTISKDNQDKLFTGVAGNGPVSAWDEVFDNSQQLTTPINYSQRPRLSASYSLPME